MRVNTDARSRNQLCCGNAININYCKCVSLAFVMQHVQAIRRFILPSVGCLSVA